MHGIDGVDRLVEFSKREGEGNWMAHLETVWGTGQRFWEK